MDPDKARNLDELRLEDEALARVLDDVIDRVDDPIARKLEDIKDDHRREGEEIAAALRKEDGLAEGAGGAIDPAIDREIRLVGEVADRDEMLRRLLAAERAVADRYLEFLHAGAVPPETESLLERHYNAQETHVRFLVSIASR